MARVAFFFFDSFKPGVKISITPRDGGFPKRPRLYISSNNLAKFAVSRVKISFSLCGGFFKTRAQNGHFQWLV